MVGGGNNNKKTNNSNNDNEPDEPSDQQILTLSGFGLPFDPPQRDRNEVRRSDVRFEFGGRKFFANDNLYLVTSSIPTGIAPKYDQVFKELLELDPNALIVLVLDVAEVRERRVGNAMIMIVLNNSTQWNAHRCACGAPLRRRLARAWDRNSGASDS